MMKRLAGLQQWSRFLLGWRLLSLAALTPIIINSLFIAYAIPAHASGYNAHAVLGSQQGANHSHLGKSSSQNYPDVFGHLFNGQPGVSYRWQVADLPMTGYQLGPTALVDWGDSSSQSKAQVSCDVSVLRCSVLTNHVYTRSGSYEIGVTVPESGARSHIIFDEAVIFPTPSGDQARRSIGELTATDSPKSQFWPCTATVVHSVSQNLIVTAAHCVMDVGGGHLHAHFIFAPNYNGNTCGNLLSCGKNKDGYWTASSSDVTFHRDLVGGHQRLDFAFIKLHPYQQKRTLESVVGGVPIEFNGPDKGTWLAFGYPHGNPIPGQPGTFSLNLRVCIGISHSVPEDRKRGIPGPPGPEDLDFSCNQQLTDGASGGPWIDNTGAVGAINQKFDGSELLGTHLLGEAESTFLKASFSLANPPGTDLWLPTGSMSAARMEHTATLLSNGRVLVVGSSGSISSPTTTVLAELYDPATGGWTFTGAMNKDRAGHTATLLPNGTVLVAGGYSSASYDRILASAELYDPSTGRWTPTGAMNEGRVWYTATLLPNGTVLVAGGCGSTSCLTSWLSGILASAELASKQRIKESYSRVRSDIPSRAGLEKEYPPHPARP